MNDMSAIAQRPPPQPFEPTEPLSVTLEAQQWNQVLGLLHEVAAPLRVTQPLVQRMVQQLQRQEGL